MIWLIAYLSIGVFWAAFSLIAVWATLTTSQKKSAARNLPDAVLFFGGLTVKFTLTWPYQAVKGLLQHLAEQKKRDQ